MWGQRLLGNPLVVMANQGWALHPAQQVASTLPPGSGFTVLGHLVPHLAPFLVFFQSRAEAGL